MWTRTRGPFFEADDAFSTTVVTTMADALERLATDPVDCVVSGYDLPDGTGIDLLAEVWERSPDLPFVLHTDAATKRPPARQWRPA